MSTVTVSAHVPGTVEQVRALWFDVRRWPSFVEGFGHLVRADPRWPAAGQVVWQSTPHGRGMVVERADGGVQDDRIAGRQEVTFEPDGDEVFVTIRLEYQVREANPLTPLVDVLFIRRAQRDSLARTLRRFAIEARAEWGLGGP